MRSRLVGLYLSGYSASRAAAFTTLVTNSGRFSRHSSAHDASTVQQLQQQAFSALERQPQQTRLIHDTVRTSSRFVLSSVGSGASTEEQAIGQDTKEVFDVYLPPASLSVLSGPPKPAGFTKARGLVHTDGDWHRSVHIWLYNGEGEMILQKRSSSKDTFPGMWDVSVGGHFTSGEGSLETAVKETQEELGLDVDETSFRFVCTVATSSKGSTPMHGSFVCNEYKDLYLLRYDGALEDLQFAPSEVEDVKRVHMDELKETYSSEDPGYINRPEYYTEPLFAALKDAISQQ